MNKKRKKERGEIKQLADTGERERAQKNVKQKIKHSAVARKLKLV